MGAELGAYVLADLALIIIVVRLGGRLAAALRQPPVVGEIIGGVLIGPTVLGGHVASATTNGFGLVNRLFPAEAFTFLSVTSHVGLVLYMFLVGIELEGRLLAERRRPILIVASATAIAPIALGVAAAPLFDGPMWRAPEVNSTTFALFLAAGFAATALPVMARLLQDSGLMADSCRPCLPASVLRGFRSTNRLSTVGGWTPSRGAAGPCPHGGGKMGPGYIAGRASGLTGSEANALGVLLSCGGLLVVVVGLLGLQLGVITPQLQTAFVIGAFVTLVMAGPLLDHFTASC